jgi:hypothetical protein
MFDSYTETVAEVMATWRIFRNFVAPILRCGALPFNAIAYLNLLKWRTESSSGLTKLYDLSWAAHTREQLELLAPNRVIAIGADAGKKLARHQIPGVGATHVIPRVIGNNIGVPGRQAIAEICKELQT